MRDPLRLPTFAFLFALLFTALLAPAAAEAQAADAKRFLEAKHDAVQRLLRKKPRSDAEATQREKKLESILEGLVDYEELSKQALGDHWDARSAEERAEFVSLLRQLVERSYKSNLQQTLDYQLRYGDAEAEGDTVLVRTTARSRKNRRAPEVSIDYRLRRVDGQFRVYDIITDGVSMVRNYRSQFHRIIEKDAWKGLIDRMKKKLEG